MTVRFLADEDVNVDILAGLRFREPTADILDVKSAALRGTKDPILLELAAEQDRILITHDRNTMTRYFRDRTEAGKPNPGIFILPQRPSAIGGIIEWLVLVWVASEAEEWRNRIFYVRVR